MMSRKKLCICDYDEEYAERFSRYIWKRRGGLFELFTFSETDAFYEYMKKKPADVFIFSEEFYADTIRDGLADSLHGGIIFVLASEESEHFDDVHTLYKYASAADNLQSIIDISGLTGTVAASGPRRKTKIIGVYSPCRRCGKTQLALALARELAQNLRSAFISYEDLCGTMMLQSDGEHLGISDVLYACATGEAVNAFAGLPMKTDGNLSLLLAAACAEDIREGDPGALCAVLTGLAEERRFDRIVVDIGDALRSPWELLMLCDRIIVPRLSDEVSSVRMQRFMEEAERHLPDAEQRVIRIDAPNGEEQCRMAAVGIITAFAG